MRRLLRHSLNVLTVLSAALCVAAVLLSARSRRVADNVYLVTDSREVPAPGFVQYNLTSEDGSLILRRVGFVGPPGKGDHWRLLWLSEAADLPPRRFRTLWEQMGFSFWRERDPPQTYFLHYWGVTAPYWAFALALLALPAARARRLAHRRSRTRQGLCAACGYDLRATPGRCPECGATTGATGAMAPKS